MSNSPIPANSGPTASLKIEAETYRHVGWVSITDGFGDSIAIHSARQLEDVMTALSQIDPKVFNPEGDAGISS